MKPFLGVVSEVKRVVLLEKPPHGWSPVKSFLWWIQK